MASRNAQDEFREITPEADADADAASIEVVKLFKPIFIDGREVKELTLNFDNLTGDTIPNIESEMMANRIIPVGGAALSQTYNMYVAARAAGVNISDIKRLSIRDVTRVISLTQNFLMQSASDEDAKSGE